jgi:hypothetical protein
LWNRRYITRLRTKDILFKDVFLTEITENQTKEVIPNFFNASLIIDYLLYRISESKWSETLQVLFAKYPDINLPSM